MKRTYWLILIAVLGLYGIGYTAWLNIQGQNGLTEIQQRGVLRVGLDASFPPFEMLNESGQVIGLDAEIAQHIAQDLGVEVTFLNIGFDGLYDAVKIGQVDLIISGLPVDNRLTEDIAYSVNYFNAGQVLVTTLPQIQSLEDLNEHSIAVEWGSMADMEGRRLKEQYGKIVLNQQPDPQTAIQHDLAIVDSVTALSHSDKRIVTYLTNDWYAAAVSPENRALLSEVNRTLNRLLETGEMDQLQAKWF
ncbi:MAG: transporter substrate-binding domain-containing protein [Chloroflexota bacterium]